MLVEFGQYYYNNKQRAGTISIANYVDSEIADKNCNK